MPELEDELDLGYAISDLCRIFSLAELLVFVTCCCSCWELHPILLTCCGKYVLLLSKIPYLLNFEMKSVSPYLSRVFSAFASSSIIPRV